ncbi:helix-turn-helix domain-containing protein [Methylobacillus gramineus]|uniref:helix-turn-helix domain-containing protein n=1 Tax=Methylobacillus gramineus TaxID=755169 RepID=UPI001D0006EF|nr:helix-turn-helix transcriptional regulator [Methylobacillus gramineus]MCB5184423.1 helix-turn-helix domain-containing protein [Methylobacillus gramineus]
MSTIKDNFYLRLREERGRLSFSQALIAEKCLVSRVIWGKYESGTSLPGADVLMKLAEVGADIVYLLTGSRADIANKSYQDAIGYDRSDLEELLEVFAHTNDEGRQTLLSLARYIKKST